MQSRRQFVQNTYAQVANQADLLLTQIKLKNNADGENPARLRQKLLTIEVMKPFMTFDALELVDGTSKETMAGSQREESVQAF